MIIYVGLLLRQCHVGTLVISLGLDAILLQCLEEKEWGYAVGWYQWTGHIQVICLYGQLMEFHGMRPKRLVENQFAQMSIACRVVSHEYGEEPTVIQLCKTVQLEYFQCQWLKGSWKRGGTSLLVLKWHDASVNFASFQHIKVVYLFVCVSLWPEDQSVIRYSNPFIL